MPAHPPSCDDGIQNQDETGIDCGGSTCPACLCTWGPFSEPELITGLGLSGALWGATLSSDGLTLYVSEETGGQADVYSATREDRGTAFFAAVLEPNINASSLDWTLHLSFDGLSLYLSSDRPGGSGGEDIWLATRTDTASSFSAPTCLPGVNSESDDFRPSLTQDELTLVFASNRPGGAGSFDLWITQRATKTDAFSAPANLTELNTADREAGPTLSADGLTIYFASNRNGSRGGTDIWRATRPDPASPFGAPENLAVANTSEYEAGPALSPDGRELFFSSERSGARELWRSIRDCTD